MTERTYTLRTDLRCPCRGYFSETPLECSECGHIGCVDCDCRCTAAITGRTVEFASAEFDHYRVGDPDEIRLGRRIQDVDAGGVL